jgi:hypothetical protein
MSLTDIQASEILKIHDSLWNALYESHYANNSTSKAHKLTYKDISYQVNIPAHCGYASVLLPNSNGKNFLWITQNIHKSTYGTFAIRNQKELGNDHRITWIVDTNNGLFSYRSNITTTRDSQDNLIFGAIEIYDSLGKETIWSNNQAIVTRKAAF